MDIVQRDSSKVAVSSLMGQTKHCSRLSDPVPVYGGHRAFGKVGKRANETREVRSILISKFSAMSCEQSSGHGYQVCATHCIEEVGWRVNPSQL